MATTKRKPAGKKEQGNELLENPEVLSEKLSKGEEFLSKNRNLVFGLGGFIALLIAVIFFVQYNKQQKNETAQNEMFQAVYYFEEGSYDNALFGDGNALGFLDIIKDFGGTDAGNLARFYAGVSYMQKRDFDNALKMLNDFSADDLLLAARRHALIGDCYMELGNYSNAAASYAKAANTNSNRWFTPSYLMKLGLAYENAGDNAKAIAAYSRIITEFPGAPEVQDAKKFQSKLENLK